MTGFDPASRVEQIHGAESMGLGTSTFLEGAPASRAAIQRRQSETEFQGLGNGLQRKKSLAQKIRGINNRGTSDRVTSSDRVVNSIPKPGSPARSSGSRKHKDKNPFFQDYDDAYERKGEEIQQVAEGIKTDRIPATRPRSTGSTKVAQEPEGTTPNEPVGSVGGDEEMKTAGGGGFISRVKSLRRPKVDRKTTTPTD